MTDEMRRLKEESRSAFARGLLDSADDDRAPEGAGGRALASLGIGAAGIAAAGTAKAAGALLHGATGVTGSIAPAAKLGALVLVKWVGVGVLSAVVVAGSVVIVRSRTEPAEHAVGTTESVPVKAVGPRTAPVEGTPRGTNGYGSPQGAAFSTPPAASSAPLRELITAPPQPPSRATSSDGMHQDPTLPTSRPSSNVVGNVVDTSGTRPPSTERAPVTAGGDSVTRQLGALAEVRKALVAHHPQDALDLLRAFDEHYPTSAIGEEVMVVRIDALVDAGQRTDASSLADVFLARYPESPSADHIRKKVRAP